MAFSFFLAILLFVCCQGSVFPGRTTAIPGWIRKGNHNYYTIPLVATGNLMPYLEGSYGSYTPSATRKFQVFGSIDGMGVEVVGDYYYLYVNHEYLASHIIRIPGDDTPFTGAPMSLFMFNKNWEIVGGKYLVESQISGATGQAISQPFGGLCSATLIQKDNFEGGAVFLSSEEGDGGYESWAVYVETGQAVRLEGCGALHHENTIVASSYLPKKNHPSKKTVILTTDDSPSGEVFMYVGDQTASDPNGFSMGTLYVLRVEPFSYELMDEGTVYTTSWTAIPRDVAIGMGVDGYNAIDAWVNDQNRSTNFRKIEDICEDPNESETFYFAATGGPFPIDSTLTLNTSQCALGQAITGGCDNPFSKIYRLKIDKTDPTAPGTIELVLTGSAVNGGGFDNVLVKRDGKILLLEDQTPISLEEVYKPNGRFGQVIEFDPVTKTVEPFMEVDYKSLQPNDLPYTQHCSHSGLIELFFTPQDAPMFINGLQGPIMNQEGDQPGLLKVFAGQIALYVPLDPNAVDPGQVPKSFGVIGEDSVVCGVTPGSSEFTDRNALIVALSVGWAVAVVLFIALIIVGMMKMAGQDNA